MKKFTKHQTLQTRSICDHNCIFKGVILNRTPKTVTIKVDGYRDAKRCKIHTNDEGEFIYPLGRYSMAPVMRA